MESHAIDETRQIADAFENELEQHIDARRGMSPVSIIRYDRQCSCIGQMPEFRTISGNLYTEAMGARPSEPSRRQERFLARLQSSLEVTLTTGRETGFEWMQSGNGDPVWKTVLVVPEFGRGAEVASALAIISDITAHKEMEGLLRTLARRRVAEREEERRRIAHELHDDLGQLLIVLRMTLMLSAKKSARENATSQEAAHREVALVDTIIQAMRDVSQSLRPTMLELGLVPALEWLTTRFSAHTGVLCKLHAPERDADIPEEQKTAIFRIAQESLTNAVRHGKAEQIEVSFARDRDSFVLEVRDNGTGFDVNITNRTATLGLTGMQERAIGAGGEVVFRSRPQCGTVVRASFPVTDTDH